MLNERLRSEEDTRYFQILTLQFMKSAPSTFTDDMERLEWALAQAEEEILYASGIERRPTNWNVLDHEEGLLQELTNGQTTSIDGSLERSQYGIPEEVRGSIANDDVGGSDSSVSSVQDRHSRSR